MPLEQIHWLRTLRSTGENSQDLSFFGRGPCLLNPRSKGIAAAVIVLDVRDDLGEELLMVFVRHYAVTSSGGGFQNLKGVRMLHLGAM